MSVPISCPHCRAQCLFGDEFLGRTVQCLYCGKQMRLPASSPATAAPPPRRHAPVPSQAVRPALPPVPRQTPAKVAAVLPSVPVSVARPPLPSVPTEPTPSPTPLPLRIMRGLWGVIRFLIVSLVVGGFRLGRWLYGHPRVALASLGVAVFLTVTWLVYNAFRGDRPASSSSPGGEPGAKIADTLEELITLQDSGERLTCAVFSNDGASLYTGSHEGAIKSWPLLTRQAVPLLKLPRKVSCLAIAPKQPLLAAATAGDEVFGWDHVYLWKPGAPTAEPALAWPNFADFEKPGEQLVFNPEGTRLLACGKDRVVSWDTGTRAIMSVNKWDFTPTAALARDGKTIAAAMSPGITMYEVTEAPYVPNNYPKPALRLQLGASEGKTFDIFALTCGPDGKVAGRARVAQKSDVVILAAPGKWLPLEEPFQAHDDARVEWIRTETLRFSPDGKMVASGGSGWLALWDTKTGVVLASIPAGGPGDWGEPLIVTFAPNGRTVAAAWQDGKVRLWTPRLRTAGS